jgi:hypothetical protein
VPTTFSRLTPRREIQTKVNLSGEEVVFTFDANGATLNWGERWDEATEAGPLADILLELITAWDVIKEDGSPDPINREHLMRMPMWALNKINVGLQTASGPPSEEGNASSLSSVATAQAAEDSKPDSENSPNGSSDLTSPSVSASPSSS